VVLGYIGDSAAVPALIHALGDSTADVRMAAAVALGQIDAVTAVPALILALADNHHWVRRCVRTTLRNMGNASTLPRKVLATTHIPVADRIAILAMLGRADAITGSRLQYNVLPLSDYCQSLLQRDDITTDVKTGARAVLAYRELVRHSAPGAAPETGSCYVSHPPPNALLSLRRWSELLILRRSPPQSKFHLSAASGSPGLGCVTTRCGEMLDLISVTAFHRRHASPRRLPAQTANRRSNRHRP
jgi:hypothetical protein